MLRKFNVLKQLIIYFTLLQFTLPITASQKIKIDRNTEHDMRKNNFTQLSRICIHDGDVNNDGFITAADAQLTYLIVLNQYSPTPDEFCSADCNGDSYVTSGDVDAIFVAALGGAGCLDQLPTPTSINSFTPVPTNTPTFTPTFFPSVPPITPYSINCNVSGFVWDDRNGDGTMNENLELYGLNDITVYLYVDDNCNRELDVADYVVDSTITDIDIETNFKGWYSYSDQTYPCCLVMVNTTTLPIDYELTTTSNNPFPLYLFDHDRNDVYFGYWRPADIHGIVTGEEASLENATVMLFNSSWVLKYTEITDESGRYLFEKIPQGSYFIYASGNNLEPTGYIGAYKGNSGSTWDRYEAMPICVFYPTQSGNIDLDLEAGGAISGVIQKVDESPIPNVLVIASGIASGTNSAETITDEYGFYKIGGLIFDEHLDDENLMEYVISTHPHNKEFNVTYYGGTQFRENAQKIRFTTPSEITNANIVLYDTGTISGQILHQNNSTPVVQIPVAAYLLVTTTPIITPTPVLTPTEPASPAPTYPFITTITPTPRPFIELFSGIGTSNSIGSYRIDGLKPGTYRIKALGNYNGFSREYYKINEVAGDVQVLEGQETENITIYITEIGSIAGLIIYHGNFSGPTTILFYSDSNFLNCVKMIELPYIGPFECNSLPYDSYYIKAVMNYFDPETAFSPQPYGVYGNCGTPIPVVVENTNQVWIGSIPLNDPSQTPNPSGTPSPMPSLTPTQDIIPPSPPIIITITPIPENTNQLLIEIEGTAEQYAFM